MPHTKCDTSTKIDSSNMKKFLFLLLFILPFGDISFSQEYFHYDDPAFSFSIPSGWMEYKSNPSLLMYGKFVKNKDGRIGGILRVGQDIYTRNLLSIWNLNQDDEKRNLEKEAVLRNYSFKKETLNGNNVVKLNFETTIGEGQNRKDFKAVIYKYLVIQNNKEHVIFFFLITDPSDFDADNKDLLKIISSINFSSNKTGMRSAKEVIFNGHIYKISKPNEYDYFDNSVFGNTSIKEFTKTNLLSTEVFDLELLVPKSLENNPIVHYYSYKVLENQNVTFDEFKEYKTFWKNGYSNGTYDSLAKEIFSDSLIIKQFGKMSSKAMGYFHISESDSALSTLVYINGNMRDNILSKVAVSNYLFINNTVILIKLSMDYKRFADVLKIKNQSELFVNEFFEINTL